MTENVMTKLVVNCETGEETIVPLTAEEIADHEQIVASIAAQTAELEAKAQAQAAAKASAIAKLAALGLTQEEAKAIAG